ncbi:CapA family protein [Mesorhizobium sp. NZP2234]|jgi:poly-gamma-glutamate capsule biosynthesis protein CapA/YwtB (metallophosphatase superfamily)|uniref:CapA family protein n=1 Tax=Mesorhizobium sp. NZP2234 TaxID=2483402 RepID=UPI00155548C6|nr:CapA family protein [Mesorhizobium sp. NZP2234]QKC91914.1 CapA family protein [Mesorhizobium sp. NZP2234]
MAEQESLSDVDRKIRLVALGDIILSRPPHDPNNGLFGIISSADVATGNLEFTLTGDRAPNEKLIALRADPKVAGDIAAWGVNVLSLANNHAMDFGTAGLLDSIAAVKAAGMVPVGAGDTLEQSLDPHIIEIGGSRIAFFGISTHLPTASAASSRRAGIAPVRISNRYLIDPITLGETPGMAPYVQTEVVTDDLERLCAAICDVSQRSDLVVVNIHWGVPLGWTALHQNELADYQRPLAHAAIEAGASVIIGHGPHVIQSVEFHRNSPILYSIGNFIMHDILPETAASAGAFPNYEWDSLRTFWNSIGCIAQLAWRNPQELPTVELLITKLDDNGESRAASSDDARQLHERLAQPSGKVGTLVELRQIDGYWSLAFRPLKH